MPDTLRIITQKPFPVNVLDNNIVNWNLWTLVVACLSLIAAAILPFLQKKYEERKSKFSFTMYMKMQLGYLFNLLTYDKIDYIKPTISDNPLKEGIIFPELTKRIIADIKEHQNSLQPRILFQVILNLQQYCHHVFQISFTMNNIDITKLKENILANGEKLSESELRKTYGLLSVLKNFSSIALFHDRFGSLKSVQREIKNNVWVGLKLDKDILTKQDLMTYDMKEIINNESSLNELVGISGAVYNLISEYFELERMQKLRAEKTK